MNNNYFYHSGIKGQKWGVRRFQNEDGTLTEEGKQRYGYYDKADGTKDIKRLDKDARKDASEYARAKAYYGEGAGTRRKQIKNLISERMKDADYEKAFNKYLSEQDMAAHQKAANRERKTQDVKNATVRTARGVKNFLLGNAVPMTLTAMSIGAVLKYTGVGSKIASYGRQTMSNAMNWVKQHGSKVKYSTAARNASSTAFNAYHNWRG